MPSARSGPPAATIRPGACPASDESESSGTALRYRIQAINGNAVYWLQKKSRPTALCVGDARKPFWPVRCRPAEGAGRLPKRTAVAGVPLVRFDHSLSEYKQAFMSHGHCHKPRGTRSDVVILNLSPSSGI